MNTKTNGCALVVAATLAMSASVAHAANWTPPIGIPAPSFGINDVARAAPNPWTVSTPGFYYVDATIAAATDTSNPYGTPAKPRRTIPTTLPAGAVVELHGTYDTAHTSPGWLAPQGTAANPVFIRGVSATNRPLVRRAWQVSGTYLIVENVEFGPTPDQSSTGSFVIRLPASHVVLRNSDVHGTLTGGGVGIVDWQVPYGQVYTGPGVNDNIVLYHNTIHDNGDVNATYDQDVHGISLGDHANHVWVVDNEIYRNSGDGIQINAGVGQGSTTHHLYIGRNIAHHNKQTGFWTKQATDVIFSQNESYAHRPSNFSIGQCMGAQYAPDWVWFLYNHVHDCDYGVHQASDSQEFSHTFVIGNVMENIHHSDASDPASAWGPAAVMMSGGYERHVINNTIYNVDSGVNIATGTGSLDLADNIIGDVVLPQASHMLLGLSAMGRNTTFHNNLLFGDPRLDWGSGQTHPTSIQLAGWQSLSDDPQFVNAAGADFHLQSTSPALGKGEVNVAYTTFQQRYGISIATDIEGTPRPSGADALGAYEKACSTSSAPGAPQGFTGTNTNTAITLQWTAPPTGCSGAPSFLLEIGSVSGSSDLGNVSVGTVTTLSIPDVGVPPGSYYFRVRAQTNSGTSPASNEVALRFGAPDAPTALVISLTSSKATLAWTAPAAGTSVAGYLLDAGSAPGLSDRGTFQLSASSTMLTGSLPPKGTYYMRVRAQNSAGASGPSNEVTLVVP